ncbi:MAG: hypothetical protein ACK2T6_07985 [Anaerolineae bacterium]|jgi:formyltetrahydrofolate synthetase
MTRSAADDARDKVCAKVYGSHPALKGVRPSVERRGANVIYTFAASVPTSPGGPKTRQVVRATVDPTGKIVKLVASR